MSAQRRTTIKRRTAISATPVQTSVVARFRTIVKKGCLGAVPLLRHPFVLLVVGFLFTNGVAVYITNKIDNDRRRNEATIRDYDQLRSSIDDLVSSFELYASASKHAMLSLQSHSSDATLQQANRDYQAAYSAWVQRRAIDSVAINQRLVSSSSGSVVMDIGNQIRLGTELLDNCIQSHFNEMPGLRMEKSNDLTCAVSPPLADFTIPARLMALRKCMEFFAGDIRPHPRFDLGSEASHNAMRSLLLTGIDEVCSPEKLIGIKMPLRGSRHSPQIEARPAG